MSQTVPEKDGEDAEGRPAPRAGRRWTHPFTLARRIFGNAVFSSLTRRILFFNLVALVVLVILVLAVNIIGDYLRDRFNPKLMAR